MKYKAAVTETVKGPSVLVVPLLLAPTVAHEAVWLSVTFKGYIYMHKQNAFDSNEWMKFQKALKMVFFSKKFQVKGTGCLTGPSHSIFDSSPLPPLSVYPTCLIPRLSNLFLSQSDLFAQDYPFGPNRNWQRYDHILVLSLLSRFTLIPGALHLIQGLPTGRW